MSTVDLFAIQPRIGLDDYASAEAFAEKHRFLAEQTARWRGQGPALAVWPEMVGAFLGLMGHVADVRDCTSTDQALRRIALRRLPALLGTMIRYRTGSANRAFLTTVADASWRTYFDTFSRIAKDFDLWVVAGSALLPRNALGDESREFRAVSPEIFNTSLTFAPDGRCVGATRKVNLVPTQEDVLDLSKASEDELGVVETPYGRLGTLICYDGFAEPHTDMEPGWIRCAPVLDRLGASVVAQPSANAWAWDAPWFFNDEAAGESQMRREQWFAEGFAKELPTLRSVRWCVNPQLVGTIFDNTFEAPSLILERQESVAVVLAQAPDKDKEAVVHARVTIGDADRSAASPLDSR